MAFGTKIEQRKTAKRNHIVNLFRQHRLLSKAEARQLSGYSMETLIGIFKSLEDEGLLAPTVPQTLDVSPPAKLKGRPAERYALTAVKNLYLGITFTSARLQFVLVNLYVETLAARSVEVPDFSQQQEFERFFSQELKAFFDQNSHHTPALQKVALSLPGQVDAEGTLKHYGLMPYLRNLRLSPFVAKLFPDAPIVVRHNVAGFARQVLNSPELRNEQGRILFVTARSGAAHALLQGGKILMDNGEMGHLRVQRSDQVCECGRTGCLDTIFSFRALRRLAPDRSLPQIAHNLSARLPEDRHRALGPLEPSYRAFSEVLLDLCAATSPDLVVLSGDLLAVLPDPVAWVETWLREQFNPDRPPAWFPDRFLYVASGSDAAATGLCNTLMDEDLLAESF